MWSLPPEERLAEWKEFRTFIGCFPFNEAVEKVVHYWSLAPFVGKFLSLDSTTWPDPWKLLADGMYDDLARALGMIYTLVLSTHGKSHTFELVRMQDQESLEVFNIAIIDSDKYVLNYVYNEVISKKQLGENLKVTHHFSALDLQLSKY